MPSSLDTILKEIQPLDSSAMAAAQSRQNSLTKPHGSLGRLEELSSGLISLSIVSKELDIV